MSETEATAVPTTPRKAKAAAVAAAKPRKPKSSPTHPKVSEMVNAAIGDLKEKGGSSLQAIKKYISGHYKVDMERLSPFIRKYLKTAVASGGLVQTKGKGASGSFRMNGPKAADKPKKPAAPAVKKAKPAAAKKAKPAAVKKSPVKKPKAVKASPKKAKVTAKPKATKAKKAKATPKKGAKGRK